MPQQHHYQDPNQAKAYFESCLDTFENSDTIASAPVQPEKNNTHQEHNHAAPPSSTTSSSSSASEHEHHHNSSSASNHNNTAVDYESGHYHHDMVPASTNMPLVYPLLAEALVREGFPGLASMLTFTQDQRQLEQVASMDHHHYGYEHDQHDMHHSMHQQQEQQHQQQQPGSMQDENYLLGYVVQEHNMLMAQHGYSAGGTSSSSASAAGSTSYNNNNNGSSNNQENTSSSSNTPALQDANNNPYSLLGDMQPLELLQYNMLMSDHQYLDALPYSMVQTGCGGDSAGGWCDSPQGLGFDSQGIYLPDHYSQPMHIPQQQQQQQYGFYDHAMSSSTSGSSPNAGSSSSGAGSSSSSSSFGFSGLNMNGWSASQLFTQGDQILERKQQAAAAAGGTIAGHTLSAMPGQVFAAHPRVQPFEQPEESDDDDDDDTDDEEVSGMTSPEYRGYQNNGNDDAHIPPLSLPTRSSRRISQSQKQERQEENQHRGYQQHQQQHQQQQQHYHPYQQQQQQQQQSHPYQYQTHSTSSKRKSDAGHQRRPSNSGGGHSRHSSMSSVHSNTSMMIELLQPWQAATSSPDSSLSSPPSPPISVSKGKSKTSNGNHRSQMETIEKRMHPCTFEGCDKSFTRAFNLRSHLNTHNGERPHKCPEEGCDWDFVRRHDLDRHIKSKHMANKPYACKQCTSRFGRSDALQRHRRLENHI
ncbi:hypothetical protein BGZ83_001569 [Gryganskiella cystojenkinii]|nr:hypothetical protein BGZ83_001569 [Gryganskiella cystojenkinii]